MQEKVLEKDFFGRALEAQNTVAMYEDKIVNRITYILHKFFAIWDLKLDTWYFDDAEEGEVGNLWRNMDSQTIGRLVVDLTKESQRKWADPIFVDKYGVEYEWCNEIPTRWLFEDFEKEVIEGKKKFEEQEAVRKAKQKARSQKQKEEDAKLLEVVKQKLSPKELAALRRSL
jgi:hypothetical protein